MKPTRSVPTSVLKALLPLSFLMCLPSIGQAQMVTTATHTAASAEDMSTTQKAIAIGADGYTRFIVVEDGPPPDYVQLTYVRCLDLACDAYNITSWPIRDLSFYTFSLAIGPDGYARIAYQIWAPVVDSAGEWHNATVGFIQCFDDDCASSTNDSFVDYAAQGDFASVAVGSDGTAYIAYDNGNVGDGPQGIGLATCSSGGCSTSTIATGIDVFDLTDGTVAIGSDGNPVVVYADDQFSFDPNYTYMSSTGHYYENGSDVVVTNDASLTDLAIGPDGFARIYVQNHAYYDSTATPGAYFVECGNVSCSSATANPIALPGSNFFSTGSLAVTADGTPRAEIDLGDTQFYTDATYYVECTAADCSTYDSSLISADSGDSAGLTSIAADPDGLPRMIVEDSSGVLYQVRPVEPIISGPPTLWWFNGLGSGVSGYATQITLTANSEGLGTSYQWSVASGSDKISLPTSTSSTVQVTGTGQSRAANDASVTVTVGGVTSAPFKLTVRAPYTLGTDPNNPAPVYSSDGTYVWSVQIPYRVLDNLLTPMPNPVSINENWTTPVANDYLNTNWRQGAAGCATLGSGGAFADLIEGETPDRTPTPVYNPQENGLAVQHWGQEWRVGTCAIGSGPRVQTDTLQKYTDHAAHTNIVSPAP